MIINCLILRSFLAARLIFSKIVSYLPKENLGIPSTSPQSIPALLHERRAVVVESPLYYMLQRGPRACSFRGSRAFLLEAISSLSPTF